MTQTGITTFRSRKKIALFGGICLYSRLPITQNLALVDFFHTFTVILPSVTRTFDNSNLSIARSNFHFRSGHFLHNFTLDNSNHVCEDVISQKIVQSIEFIFKQSSILPYLN